MDIRVRGHGAVEGGVEGWGLGFGEDKEGDTLGLWSFQVGLDQ